MEAMQAAQAARCTADKERHRADSLAAQLIEAQDATKVVLQTCSPSARSVLTTEAALLHAYRHVYRLARR